MNELNGSGSWEEGLRDGAFVASSWDGNWFPSRNYDGGRSSEVRS